MGGLDDDAFCAFVAARSRALLGTAYLLTGSHADAEDLLQASLLKVYLAGPAIRDLGALEAYARTVLVRTQVSLWRRPARREVRVAVLPEVAVRETALTPGAGSDSRIDDRDELWRALATLGARQRAVVVLRFYEDLSEADIARVLGCSAGTVKSQLSRGLSRLRQRLADRETTAGESSARAGEGR